MCGIVGIINANVKSKRIEDRLDQMMTLIERRGPDSAGQIVNPSNTWGFGHRRLSILDLSPAGHQPMVSADGNYTVVLNGEIYNHNEIRADLKKKAWRGTSDTEVLVEAIAEWGLSETLKRIVGMYAFTLYAKNENSFYLVRDRVGEKPLYWARNGGEIIFGSQLNCVTNQLDNLPAIDLQALDYFVKFGFFPKSQSVYKNVFKVKPGEYIKVSLPDLTIQESAYWNYNLIRSSDEVSTPESFELALENSVKSELLSSDVPIGAFLSGGIDSSLVVALAQKHSSKPIKTFSIGFDDEKLNEAPWAKLVAKHLGSEHNEFYFTEKDLLEKVSDLPMVFDEPLGDASQLPTLLVSQFARKQVTVALSGDGGDELFAGYDRYEWQSKVNRLRTNVPAFARDLILKIMPLFSEKEFFGRRLNATRLEILSSVMSAKDDLRAYQTWVSPSKGQSCVKLSQSTLSLEPAYEGKSLSLSDLLDIDFCTYLTDDILVKVDRAAMYYSLETRAPFLDHRVIEQAVRLPMSFKMKGSIKKVLLKDILAKYIPMESFNRPKQGFGVPMDRWLRTSLRSWAEELLKSNRNSLSHVFDWKIVDEWWNKHQSEKYDYSGRLWNVLVFIQWWQKTNE